jgi:flagellar hook-basal body complex protein FliE
MSGINPISGINPQAWSTPVSGASGAGASSGKPKFGEVLKSYVDNVDKDQQVSAAAIQDLLTGKTQDVMPVVAAVAKADLSFKLLMGVRNKVIEAYKQTMNMQV